ncbi:MAG: phenylacetate-CoA oxygenase subunit PaaJ [Bacteroidetes bacterium]|nr:phenylacetate-CoA oxygenase subunit PaaJ [Bacteroidota bacterium]
MFDSKQILEWLEEVKDPEIPVLSLVDLGVITRVEFKENKWFVDMTPTFVGCPAMDYMKQDVERVLQEHGIKDFEVRVTLADTWNSDKISEKGRLALKQFGLAPPPGLSTLIDDLSILEHVACPRCNGTHTELRSPFGSTLCRSIHYCHECKEAFEQMKPLGHD